MQCYSIKLNDVNRARYAGARAVQPRKIAEALKLPARLAEIRILTRRQQPTLAPTLLACAHYNYEQSTSFIFS